jgi:glycosyltransferase involved in cell wall biosynthesis
MSTEINVEISVVVPVYNIESYLSDCIDSLINQTFKNIEIILVDDGSPDHCGKICDDYALRDERIKVIHKENGGPVSARNTGYEASTGNWVMYLDGDDWLDTDICEILANCVTEYEGIDVVFWNWTSTRTEWTISGWKSDTEKQLYVGEECMDLAYHTLVYKSGISSSYCKLIRKEFAAKYGLSHNVRLSLLAEDVEFSLRVFAAAKKALFIRNCNYHYRYNPTSITHSINKDNPRVIINAFTEIKQYILRLPEPERFIQIFYQRVLYALIAETMANYSINNKKSIKFKMGTLQNILNENKLFQEALLYGSLSGMDPYRKAVIYSIKYRCYFLLPFISIVKYLFIKKIFYRLIILTLFFLGRGYYIMNILS